MVLLPATSSGFALSVARLASQTRNELRPAPALVFRDAASGDGGIDLVVRFSKCMRRSLVGEVQGVVSSVLRKIVRQERPFKTASAKYNGRGAWGTVYSFVACLGLLTIDQASLSRGGNVAAGVECRGVVMHGQRLPRCRWHIFFGGGLFLNFGTPSPNVLGKQCRSCFVATVVSFRAYFVGFLIALQHFRCCPPSVPG